MPSFLDLSAELRLIIYSYYSYMPRTILDLTSLNMRLLCKQIRAEYDAELLKIVREKFAHIEAQSTNEYHLLLCRPAKFTDLLHPGIRIILPIELKEAIYLHDPDMSMQDFLHAQPAFVRRLTIKFIVPGARGRNARRLTTPEGYVSHLQSPRQVHQGAGCTYQ